MRIRGPWTRERVDAFLSQTIVPVRLAHAARDGHPEVLSLWFTWRDGAVWCATSPRARVVERLAREPRCGFEVAPDAPPYRGVRGRGRAELVPERGAEVLLELVDRYLGTRDSSFALWLLARAEHEMAIRIAPERVTTWDFAERMG